MTNNGRSMAMDRRRRQAQLASARRILARSIEDIMQILDVDQDEAQRILDDAHDLHTRLAVEHGTT